jgi:hypothetical protein
MADVVQTTAPAAEIRFVGSADDGYEIQVLNNEGMADEALAALLAETIEKLEGGNNRARGMW